MTEMLTPTDWGLLGFGAMLIGMAKSGLTVVNILAVPIYAAIFGGKVSTAIIVPLLLIGDIAGAFHYHKKTRWSQYIRLLPAALAGLLGGMLLGHRIPDNSFRFVMGIIILVCLVLMVAKDLINKDLTLPDNMLAHSIGGFTGGFATMVGNAAGPIMSLYLLSMRLPKEVFIGTAAMFFLTMNFLKMPIHLFVWNTMTPATLKVDLIMLPVEIIGFLIGLKIVKKIPEKPFKILILLATLAGTIKMFF